MPVVASALVLVLAVGAVGSATAKGPKAPKKTTLRFQSKLTYKKNKFIKDASRFNPGVVTIKSGGTLTLKNTSEAPHTFSIVKKSDLPRGIGQIGNCGSPGTICDKILSSHQPDAQGNPSLPIVDVGPAGIDEVGDSVFLNPKQTVKVTVSAKRGTLRFMCGIHGWMQGVLHVR
jgi:plastocyanin